MRHFKLVNDLKQVFDLTTTENLFYEISGLGFEEENVFNRIGSVWWLSHTEYKQGTISGKMIFTEEGGTDPYQKYQAFARFISYPPLTLLYNPFGPVKSTLCNDSEDEENAYYMTVRVGKLEKTEKNEYGVIDSAIDFTSYTPWYRIKDYTKNDVPPDDGSADTGWIWGGTGTETVIDSDTQESSTVTVTYPPLTFEPTGSQTATRARFRWEPTRFITCPVDAAGSSPAIITIHGPLVNPTWVHYLVKGDSSVVVGTGSFTRSVELLDGDQLIIDSTPSKYTITHLHANGTESDLYPYRNFGETCFINLKTGINRILVMSEDGTLATNVEVKGQIYDATV